MSDSFEDFQDAKRVKRAESVIARESVKGAERPGVSRGGRNAETMTLVGEPGELADIPAMLRRRGIDPDVWLPDPKRGITVNEWEVRAKVGDDWIVGTNHQLKVYLLQRDYAPSVTVIQCNGPAIPFAAERVAGKAGLVAFLSDQQVAGHRLGYDPRLHELVCRWLDFNKPGRTVIGGDVANGTAGSRHVQTIAERASGDAELAAAHALLHDYRTAVGPDAWMGLTGGNHEAHYVQSERRNNPPQADLHPAGDPSLPAIHSMTNLLKLDRLGIAEAPREYPFAQFKLSPYLAARHGWIARKGSGASALATLNHLGYSVVVGHTHRQGIVYKTTFEIDGRPRVICAVEAGTLCMVDDTGQNYAPNPDWQSGFAAFHMAEDGTFSPSLATYVNGALLWEGQRYTMKRGKVLVAA